MTPLEDGIGASAASVKGSIPERHSPFVRRTLCLPFLVAVCACAAESDDRAAIARTIGALNQFPQPADLFTADSDARSVLDRLWKGKRPSYRVRRSPTVTISHEPWGEATIGFPLELENPRIVVGAIRLLSSDEALAAASFVYHTTIGETTPRVTTEITPLLFVMKKTGAEWKIESIRLYVP
jgi:hypothetical protein